MTKTDIARKAAHMIVALNVASVVEVKIDEHTEFDGDSIPVQVGSFVVGNLVANQTDRFTDAAIYKVVDLANAWKARKNEKPEVVAES